ncbi:hypothetical protein CYMTET_20100 [Cymbomonas tetramitiformis]|uniref:Uncharacterized protein n=1 Tax=Cymbomonas tetramitiformis TaxID=36881 RepID=A0AAE0L483_9CHLO|nr:hypothetical protein CYMTET_20100 [Cymbomonas tetramitiformis]
MSSVGQFAVSWKCPGGQRAHSGMKAEEATWNEISVNNGDGVRVNAETETEDIQKTSSARLLMSTIFWFPEDVQKIFGDIQKLSSGRLLHVF